MSLIKLWLLLASLSIVLADDFVLDVNRSKAYYVAKKEQFFGTYTVVGSNKNLNGSLKRFSNGYKGIVKIDAASFESGNSFRDGHVREYLDAKKHKQIIYRYRLANDKSSGIITIKGVEKKIMFPVVVQETKDRIVVEGNVTVKYSDFGIETPSNIFLKAHEDLTIGAILYFDKK